MQPPKQRHSHPPLKIIIYWKCCFLKIEPNSTESTKVGDCTDSHMRGGNLLSRWHCQFLQLNFGSSYPFAVCTYLGLWSKCVLQVVKCVSSLAPRLSVLATSEIWVKSARETKCPGHLQMKPSNKLERTEGIFVTARSVSLVCSDLCLCGATISRKLMKDHPLHFRDIKGIEIFSSQCFDMNCCQH